MKPVYVFMTSAQFGSMGYFLALPQIAQKSKTGKLYQGYLCRRLISRFRYLHSMEIVGTRIYAGLR